MATRGIIISFLLTSLTGFIHQGSPAESNHLNNRSRRAVNNTRAMNPDDTAELKRQQALQLLNRIIEASKDFEDKHLIVKIKADGADLLWTSDEQRARAMFEEAFALIDQAPATEDKSLSEQMSRFLRSQLRQEILQSASRRDPNLANKLVKMAKEPGDTLNRESGCIGCANQNEKSRQYASLALREIHAQRADPARAGNLIRLALNEGLDSLIGILLRELRQKAPALADDLFIHALYAARRNTQYLAPNVVTLVWYVFPDFGKGVLKPRPQADEAQENIIPTSKEIIVQFLTFVRDSLRGQADSIRSVGINQEDKRLVRQLTYDYFVGEQLLPYMEKHMPDELANMRAYLQELIAALPSVEVKEYLAEFNRERGSQGLIKASEAEPKPEIRESYNRQAIMRSLDEGNIDQALTIVSKLDDEDARSFYESYASRQRAQAAINKSDNAAYSYIKEVPQLHEQATLIGRLALSLHYKGDKARAWELITEAQQLFQKADDREEKAKGMLELAYSSVQIDPGLGLRDLQAAVEAINAADIPASWTSYKAIISRATGRVIIRIENGLGTFRFDIGFQTLARADFNQAVLLAQAIRQKEAATLAQLNICKAILMY